MSIDYHDLKTSELEKVAEAETENAKLALESGDENALKRLRQWSEALAGIRFMKGLGLRVSEEQENQ
jgi:hypothetical protein